MIQDIQMTGFSFLDAPIIPMDTIRVFHLFYVFDGTGVLIADSSSYPCGRDSLFVFPSLEVAVPQPSLRSVLTILHVSFTCASPSMVQELCRLPRLIPAAPENRSLLMELLHECIVKQAFHQELCALYLERLLIPAAVRLARQTRLLPPAAGLSHLDDSPLAQVCSYIHSHLGEELPIDILCRIACMNSRQLNTLFRKTFHQGTVEYIRSSRLAKARELLCFSQESVTSIAEQTGFKSVHYFSRVFKESEGISPGEYKKRLGRALAPDAASHPTGKNSLV